MSANLQFRGYAGEVLSKFFHPINLFTITGVILIIFLVTLFSSIANSGFGLIVGGLAGLSLFGVFAIQASRGDLNCGIFGHNIGRGEALTFAGYYIFFNIVWAIPAVIIAKIFHEIFGITPSLGYSSFELLASAANSLRSAFSLFLFCLFILGPSITGIYTTALLSGNFGTYREVFRWLISSWRDLLPYYSMMFGGICLFIAVYAIPLGFVIYLLSQVSIGAALGAGLFSWLIPGAAGLVLSGRMTGAFVAAHEISDLAPEPSKTPTTPKKYTTSSSRSKPEGFYEQKVAVISKPEKKRVPSKAEVLARLDAICEKFPVDQNGAITELEAFIAEWPMSAESQLMSVRMYIRAKRDRDVVRAFPKAALLGLKNALFDDVIKLFKELKTEERENIAWTEELLRLLSDACVIHARFGDATWCIEKLLPLFQIPEVEIQKLIYQIAEKALEKGSPGEGIALYEKFVATYPNSPFKEFALRTINQEKLKG